LSKLWFRARRALVVAAGVVVASSPLGVYPEADVVFASAPVGVPVPRSAISTAVLRTDPRELVLELPRDGRLEVLCGEWRTTRTLSALEATLLELAERGGPRVRLHSIGEGRAGRSMFAMELGALDTPGILVVPGTVTHEPLEGEPRGDVGDTYGALDALLELVRDLVVGPEPASAVGALVTPSSDTHARGTGASPTSEERRRIWKRFEAQRVVVLFGARPDLCAPRLPAPGFDPTRNFPVDWDLAQMSGGGPYPLATPETRALARWLDTEPRLYAAALVGASPLAASSLALGTLAADEEQARLLTGPCLLAALRGTSADDAPVHGGFARHARLRAGLAVVALPSGPSGSGVPLDFVAELLDAVPRLELVLDPVPRAVGADLWQVDAVLANVGGLGTANVAHSRGRRPRGIDVSVAGGELVVGAVRIGDGPFQVVDTQRDGAGRAVLRTVDLDSGARLSLRLFVRPAQDRAGERRREAPLEVLAEAPRALPARSFVTPARER
jgi:hypothetical protein